MGCRMAFMEWNNELYDCILSSNLGVRKDTRIMDQLITQEIEEIIATGEKLVADASASQNYLSHKRVQELTSITARGG